MNSEIKNMIKGLVVLIIYYLFNKLQALPFTILGINLDTVPTIYKTIYSICFEVLLISIIILVFNKTLIKDFKDLKLNHKSYFKSYAKFWPLMLGLMMLSNFIILLFIPGSSANNQEALNEVFKIAPIYMYISAVFIAPLLEELVFRLAIRKVIIYDKIYILLSGLVFGALHVIPTFEVWTDLLYIIPYSIPGIVFAYVYTKSKNIFVPISLHLFHNAFVMCLEIIVYLFT